MSLFDRLIPVTQSSGNAQHDKISASLRLILLLIFLTGVTGTGTELLLLGHIEDWWQWVPLVLIIAGLFVLVLHFVLQRPAGVRVFQAIMLLFIISGLVGIYLHYQAKVEFKLEVNPDLNGLDLFWETIKGSSVPPVLSPGMMVQLGLVGLAWAFSHPVLGNRSEKSSTKNTKGTLR